MPSPPYATRDNLGFLLAKASQRWNELLHAGFVAEGFPEVRPSFGSVLVPLFEEDGLRMGEIAARSRLSKQTMTTLVRLTDRHGLTVRHRDAGDGRAVRVYLTDRGRRLEPVAEEVLAKLDDAAAAALGVRQSAPLDRSLRALADLQATSTGAAAT